MLAEHIETGIAPQLPLAGSSSALAITAATKADAIEVGGHVAVAFLKWFDPVGVHRIVAFDPNPSGKRGFPVDSITSTLDSGGAARLAAFVDKHIDRYNLYFQVNELRPDFQGLMAEDDDIALLRAIPVDADPQTAEFDAERVRILDSFADNLRECPPSGVTDSGGGFWAFYRLIEKVPHTKQSGDWYRAQCRGLRAALKSDNVVNPSRVARLPGTINRPDASKLAKGRTARPTSAVTLGNGLFTQTELGQHFPPDWTAPEQDKNPRAQELIDNDLRYSAHESISERPDLEPPALAKLEAAERASSKFRNFYAGDYSGTAATNGTGKRAAAALFIAHHCKPENVEEFAALIWLWAVTVEGVDYAEQKLTVRDIARLYARKVETTMQDNADRAAGRQNASENFFDHEAAAETREAAGSKDGQATKPARRLLTVSFMEAADTALEHTTKPLVQGLLDQSTLSVLYGPSNAGKTFVALDIAFHIATGLPWGGMKTSKGTALYVAAEGGPGARKRARALQKRYNREGQKVDIEFVLSTINLLDPKADLEPLIATMADLAAAGRPVMFLVIDTFSRAFAGGEENGSTDMGTMVAHFDRIRMATAAHVCVVHHSGKQIAKGARGHSLLRAATDTEIEVVPGHILVTKQRDLEGNYSADFNLVQVEIGKSMDGSPVTSAVVELVSRGAGEPGVPTQAEQTVLDAVGVALETVVSEVGDAQTFRAANVAGVMEAQGRQISKEGLRKHFGQLVAKRLLKSAGRGLYALRSPEKPHSHYFQHLTDEEVLQTVSERTGVESGASVFD